MRMSFFNLYSETFFVLSRNFNDKLQCSAGTLHTQSTSYVFLFEMGFASRSLTTHLLCVELKWVKSRFKFAILRRSFGPCPGPKLVASSPSTASPWGSGSQWLIFWKRINGRFWGIPKLWVCKNMLNEETMVLGVSHSGVKHLMSLQVLRLWIQHDPTNRSKRRFCLKPNWWFPMLSN